MELDEFVVVVVGVVVVVDVIPGEVGKKSLTWVSTTLVNVEQSVVSSRFIISTNNRRPRSVNVTRHLVYDIFLTVVPG